MFLFEERLHALVQRSFQSGMPVAIITLSVIGFPLANIVLLVFLFLPILPDLLQGKAPPVPD